MNPSRPPLIRLATEDGASVLYLEGGWRLRNAHALVEALEGLGLPVDRRCLLDGSGLDELDTSAAFVLLRRLESAGLPASAVAVRNMEQGQARLLALVRQHLQAAAAPAARRLRAHGLVQRIGSWTLRLHRLLVSHTGFVGEVALELGALLRRPGLFRFKETVSQFETVVVDAIPIVALVTSLIGIVFAYLLGVQAQRYGATIFVVDGVGLAVCRELSPILVAVIVAGRSGAAFTAQIGAMKVQEETDAIRTLGLLPIQVLVVPRLAALVLGLPLLVFVGDVAGIAGGAVIGAAQLDIPVSSFVRRLQGVLELSEVVIGLGKAPVFAAFIAMIACRMGLAVARDARSVGEHTTSTVVQSIVWVIVLDAAFAVVLQELGI
jgi:phospholipid/cholesterol/gamma-HCH transport system permease protein